MSGRPNACKRQVSDFAPCVSQGIDAARTARQDRRPDLRPSSAELSRHWNCLSDEGGARDRPHVAARISSSAALPDPRPLTSTSLA